MGSCSRTCPANLIRHICQGRHSNHALGLAAADFETRPFRYPDFAHDLMVRIWVVFR